MSKERIKTKAGMASCINKVKGKKGVRDGDVGARKICNATAKGTRTKKGSSKRY